jgi:signal transduction histidine kinase
LLDEAGFLSAAKWYVDGFGQRSGISTKLDLPTHIDRLPRRTEIALFRILQEALTNVHRHSGSRAVHVWVTTDDQSVVLKVQDFGKGIPREIVDRFWKTGNVGVGLAGIRERLKELSGRLELDSDVQGTVLQATIPVTGPDLKASEQPAVQTTQPYQSVLPAD